MHTMSRTITRRLAAGLLLAGSLLASTGLALAAPAGKAESLSLTPTRVATVAESRCTASQRTATGECRSWDGNQIRSQSDIFVVGFENNQEVGSKHVLQTVASFDLTSLQGLPEGSTVTKASLIYGEGSTTRRSATGESEYGVLPTCNTRLGLPAEGWGGGVDKVVKTTPAAVVGASTVTTASYGGWDVTPQLQQWIEDVPVDGVFVLRSADETMDVKGQQMCLSYIFNLSLAVEIEAGTEP